MQAAVTVAWADAVVPGTVLVTSVIGTKEEQKADAFNAIRMALHAATLSRASMSARSTTAADTWKCCSAIALRIMEKNRMVS